MTLTPIGGGEFFFSLSGSQRPSGTRVAVPILLPDKYAGKEQEAEALLQSLGFIKEEDLQAYQEQYGINLKQRMMETLSHKRDYNAGQRFYDPESKSYKFKTHIGMDAAEYKRLTEFVTERRTRERQQQMVSGAETRQGQELAAYEAARKRQLRAQLPLEEVTVMASVGAIPLEIAPLSLPTLAEIGTGIAKTAASVAEVVPPVAMIGTALGTPVLVGTHYGQKYAELKQAQEIARADAAYRAREAASLSELHRTTTSTIAQITTLPMTMDDAPPVPPQPEAKPQAKEWPYAEPQTLPKVWPQAPPEETNLPAPVDKGAPPQVGEQTEQLPVPVNQKAELRETPPAGGPEKKPPIDLDRVVPTAITAASLGKLAADKLSGSGQAELSAEQRVAAEYVEAARQAGKLFPNTLTDKLDEELEQAEALSVKPVKVSESGFAETIVADDGSTKWAVTADGELLIVPHTMHGEEIKHSILSGGRPVLAAGDAKIITHDGKYILFDITNKSGHFKPTVESLEIGRQAFIRDGVRTSFDESEDK